jgi:hypothetical protein
MPTPVTQQARDRLREQARREQHLAGAVLAAQARAEIAIRKRDAAIAAHDRSVAERQGAVADALITYLDQAGIGLDRASAVLDRPSAELAHMIRDRKRTRRAEACPTAKEVTE